jgi:hypothetical protein
MLINLVSRHGWAATGCIWARNKFLRTCFVVNLQFSKPSLEVAKLTLGVSVWTLVSQVVTHILSNNVLEVVGVIHTFIWTWNQSVSAHNFMLL